MVEFLKRSGKIALGAVIIIFGIIGLILPIIPGILPILFGAALISPTFRHKMVAYTHNLREKWKKYKEDRSI